MKLSSLERMEFRKQGFCHTYLYTTCPSTKNCKYLCWYYYGGRSTGIRIIM